MSEHSPPTSIAVDICREALGVVGAPDHLPAEKEFDGLQLVFNLQEGVVETFERVFRHVQVLFNFLEGAAWHTFSAVL